ncbi:type II toxin-antitoxin system RelE/ParE family toxin [Patescibacteria group bacterium]|nr:type II toxin-antitoxin system RelE/ParE family toxin [Patescibacteria group bacterium]MBU1721864.1 type II toxin-antitoxin system RelE/ParE family toxin [Patescibacteria group bacterium]MBU1901322.1 type II toxin-antitoxin system RelE/ParE family toxin [Patescibacteria group bacterium]
MVDKITKTLQRLSPKEKKWVKNILTQLKKKNLKHLDIKKLKGRTDVYRIRKGKIRIMFRMHKEDIYLLAIERRADTTYN